MDPLLIVKTGSTLPEIFARRGDYEDWILGGMDLPGSRARVVRVYADEPLPHASRVAGVVVTGSSAMVTEREPWSERTAAWLASAVTTGVPVLGICYGHQLLAHGLGGRVGRNPRGREIGTAEVRRVAAARDDALLGPLPERMLQHVTHVESVLELPPRATRLAQSDADPHQAYALAERAWGVQFHPEFDADVIRGYLAARREIVRAEGLDPEALEAAVVDSPHGAALLRRFARLAAL